MTKHKSEGWSVANQVDITKYFSLATISLKQMRAHGLTMTVNQLRELACTRVPALTIYTGKANSSKQRRQVNIWAYDDFV